ncbi:hypothetical protein NW762_010747 [Fusarium torreyae]|uniref:Uncharacterized protein n=1 Tax=Fusarium torreyae TaxID=1237075 RepID=A0A9W8RUK8_9HYPO|nr:hypothetical protein NW762_010747 [Fusarium torreyae]
MSLLEVFREGMPSKSYAYFLNGEPDLDRSTDLFNTILKRDIAWLTLHTDCVAQGLFTDRNHPEYPFHTRSSVEDTEPWSNLTSIFQCNFNLDQPWDYEKIALESGRDHHVPDLGYWVLQAPDDPEYFDVSSPSLDLLQLRLGLFDREKVSDGIE